MMSTVSPTAYLNGAFLPLSEVRISPLDRGFLFADSVYEVIPAYRGRLFRLAQHLERLKISLAAIRLETDPVGTAWAELLTELVERNGGGDQTVYLQVTRGAPAIRDHGIPTTPSEPTVFAMANPLRPLPDRVYRDGLSAITTEDTRWSACYIKSTALLANILARQEAVDNGAGDAILVRKGYLTEATAANLFVVDDGVILTPPRSLGILGGVTRDLLLELAAAHRLPCREEILPKAVLQTASEVWLTSSTREIVPVTRVDGRPVGLGTPGPVWRNMMALYQSYKWKVCPDPGARNPGTQG
jgi:D-alanine transaminase